MSQTSFQPIYRKFFKQSFSSKTIHRLLIRAYNSNMSQYQKLISLFRTFVQKVFLPHLKPTQNIMQNWSMFNSLLSTLTLNLSEVQAYVDSLPSVFPHSPSDRKEFPLHLRSQQNIHLRLGSLENSSRITRTSIGEKTKNIVFDIKQHQNVYNSGPIIKEHVQSKELSPGMDDSGKIPAKSMPDISSPKPQNYSTVASGVGLQKLFKKMMQNQQKIDALQSILSTNNTVQSKK